MSYGSYVKGDKIINFGFSSVKDWFGSVILSFPAPWSIAPLDGKYYGTVVRDAEGALVLSFWDATGEPSNREKKLFGEDWSPEAWSEYCCDTHWESVGTLAIAQLVADLRNSADGSDIPDALLAIVFEYGIWQNDVFSQVQCGGPLRREICIPTPDGRQS